MRAFFALRKLKKTKYEPNLPAIHAVPNLVFMKRFLAE